MKVRITKLSGGDAMRTDSMEGQLEGRRFPIVGEQAIVQGEALDAPFGIRLLNTSPIVSISGTENKRTITTETGSVYDLEEIE